VFFYNKTMFEELGIEAPKTWSEVEAVATAVSDKIGKPGFGFQILVDGYMEVLTQAGGEVIDLDNKTVGFDSETAREKITWYFPRNVPHNSLLLLLF
ncbi:extracellular solute-binding protein, partial [Hungatella sp. SL.1.14]|uniref:extracellular solute-binding protein n=1 Tax=Hungatella sp. SL.1.14 TaxID=2963703 RepID=UPI00210AF679